MKPTQFPYEVTGPIARRTVFWVQLPIAILVVSYFAYEENYLYMAVLLAVFYSIGSFDVFHIITVKPSGIESSGSLKPWLNYQLSPDKIDTVVSTPGGKLGGRMITMGSSDDSFTIPAIFETEKLLEWFKENYEGEHKE